MTHIFELYGGPGTGKSTTAALLFAHFKQLGVNAELVREYAKDWAWEKRDIGPYDQLYITAKQMRRESMLLVRVDVIITDSPCTLGHFYPFHFNNHLAAESIAQMVRGYENMARIDDHQRHRLFLTREKAYNPEGRYQTEGQAKQMDVDMRKWLKQCWGTVHERRSSDAVGWATRVWEERSELLDAAAP